MIFLNLEQANDCIKCTSIRRWSKDQFYCSHEEAHENIGRPKDCNYFYTEAGVDVDELKRLEGYND